MLQVHLPNAFSHNQKITSREGNRLYGRKGLDMECCSNNSKNDANTWAREEREFGKSFIILMLDCGMRPQYLLLKEKSIVI
jgi:hypothetical protein